LSWRDGFEDFDLFDDDYTVVVDSHSGKYLRFRPAMYCDTILMKYLDLNKLTYEVAMGNIPVEHYNSLLRDLGLSFQGYADMRVRSQDSLFIGKEDMPPRQ